MEKTARDQVTDSSRWIDYHLRQERAGTIALAISDAHPDDARQIVAAARSPHMARIAARYRGVRA